MHSIVQTNEQKQEKEQKLFWNTQNKAELKSRDLEVYFSFCNVRKRIEAIQHNKPIHTIWLRMVRIYIIKQYILSLMIPNSRGIPHSLIYEYRIIREWWES